MTWPRGDARNAFPLDFRVRLSAAGQRVGTRQGAMRLGTVLGYSRDGEFAWVLWDGLRSRQAWHGSYLERAQ